jgi:arsenate reductase
MRAAARSRVVHSRISQLQIRESLSGLGFFLLRRETVVQCRAIRSENAATAEIGGSSLTITIYHNPQCGTSRNTLAMIRASGAEPTVVEYLKTPPTRARLVELLKAMGVGPRGILRKKGSPYEELGLGDPSLGDDKLIDAMMAHPILIERPIVETQKGVRLCRPSEKVLEILPNADIGEFTKEDGTAVTAGRPDSGKAKA